EELDEAVLLHAALQPAAPQHQELEQPGQLQARLPDERPGVQHHHAGHPVRLLGGPAHPDRTAPVLQDGDYPGRLQLAQDAAEVVDVPLQRVPARIARLVAAAEPDMVRHDHPVPRREPPDALPVQIAPGRVAVQQEEGEGRIAGALVHHCLPDPLVDVDQAALPGEAPAEVGPDIETRVHAHGGRSRYHRAGADRSEDLTATRWRAPAAARAAGSPRRTAARWAPPSPTSA